MLLVTDAGMPSVSDPGFRLVAACVEQDLPVTCLPGPSAVTTALALSGLPCERFCFEGFAPRKDGERALVLRRAGRRATHRGLLRVAAPDRRDAHRWPPRCSAPDRRAAVCRELTKTYEEVRRGGLGELASWAADGVRGEITVVLAGAEPRQVQDMDALVAEVAASGGRRHAAQGRRRPRSRRRPV